MQILESLNKCFGNRPTVDPSFVGPPEPINLGGCGWEEVGPIINELLKNLVLVGVFIGIVMIMYAGYVLVQGQGSPASRTTARNIFIGIFIGMFLLVGSYYIVEFILNTFNVNVEYRGDILPKK